MRRALFGIAAPAFIDGVVLDGKTVLCATCQHSEALGPGAANIPPLTASVHSKHANVMILSSGIIAGQFRQSGHLLPMSSRFDHEMSAGRDGRGGAPWTARWRCNARAATAP